MAAGALLVGLNVHGWRDRLSTRSPKPQIQALAVLPTLGSRAFRAAFSGRAAPHERPAVIIESGARLALEDSWRVN
jgi:hypothetical protein